MAENECQHERLPGDPCPSPDRVWPHPYSCGCWPHHERVLTPVPDLIGALPKRKPRRKPKATPSPVLARVISDLDAEITRLQEARKRLKQIAA
jgi:hypothetical protein